MNYKRLSINKPHHVPTPTIPFSTRISDESDAEFDSTKVITKNISCILFSLCYNFEPEFVKEFIENVNLYNQENQTPPYINLPIALLGEDLVKVQRFILTLGGYNIISAANFQETRNPCLFRQGSLLKDLLNTPTDRLIDWTKEQKK